MAELGGGYPSEDSGFFTVLPTPPALLGGLTLLAEAAAVAQELGFGAEIEAIISSVEQQVAEAGALTAKAADDAIREFIARTRVRPRSPSFTGSDAVAGGGARKLLEDGIHSESMGQGSVGIGSIKDLDSVVGSDGRPFWRTQEYGSEHNVGREIHGFFQPGSEPADPQQDRRHPIFVAGAGPPMTIRRPIEARHFLRDGSAAAAEFREQQFREIEGAALGDIRAVRTLLP